MPVKEDLIKAAQDAKAAVLSKLKGLRPALIGVAIGVAIILLIQWVF